jgi:hypothetical protein
MSSPKAPDLDLLARDILDSVRYVVLGTVDEDGRTRTSPVYFTPHGYEGRGGRRFSADELSDDDGLRLWVLHAESWEVHVRAGHPTLGTGRDRRVAVDPRRGQG